MKIAFLSFYSGNVYRGVETYVHEVANRLAAFEHEVVVYQTGPKLKDSKYKTVSVPINIDWNKRGYYLPFVDYWALKLKEFTQTVLNRIDRETDVIVATNGQWQSLLCSIWTKKRKKKLVIPAQSGLGFDDRVNLMCFPDAFVSLTESQAKWAKKVNPFTRVVTIPNGVDLSKFNSRVESLNLDLPKPIILSVGALVFYKRHDLTIKAAAKIKGSLVLVGEGNKKRDIQKLGEKLLPGRFEILSFPHEEMPKVYASADLLAFPNVPWESFGIVILEAMATNLPVVVNDDPIRREIVGEGGLFVNPTDVGTYAEALEKALQTDWRNKPRKQAEKFSWDDIAKKYERLFEELVK